MCDPLSGRERLLGDEWDVHGGDDAGRRADPQDVLARQQRRDAQARSLVLPDYVVAPCNRGREGVRAFSMSVHHKPFTG